MKNKATIAAIIGCENNPEMLDKCLSRLSFVDEFWVSDLSSNNSVELLLKSKYPKAKHFYDTDRKLKNRHIKYQDLISTDYLLLISPDEFLTESLEKELATVFQTSIQDYDTIGLKSIEFNFGSNFGTSNYYSYRILKKGSLSYVKDNVHEEPTAVGRVYHAEHFYEHHSNPMLLVNAVKMFRFEMINAQEKKDEELQQYSIEKMSSGFFYRNAFLYWLRLNVRYLRTFFYLRKYRYGGLCYAYSAMLRTMAEHISRTQELQFREGRVDRNDTRGYF